MTTCLPIKSRALLPEVKSEMSTHTTQVSAWGDVRIKRGACLMYRRRSEPTGEAERAASKAARCDWYHTLGAALTMGTSSTLRKDVEVTADDLMGTKPGAGIRRRTCLSTHAMSEEVGTRLAAMKMPEPESTECSRTTSELTSSLRCLFISASTAGVNKAARIEDPVGGVMSTPRREAPWHV